MKKGSRAHFNLIRVICLLFLLSAVYLLYDNARLKSDYVHLQEQYARDIAADGENSMENSVTGESSLELSEDESVGKAADAPGSVTEGACAEVAGGAGGGNGDDGNAGNDGDHTLTTSPSDMSDQPFNYMGLVEVRDLDGTIIAELPYATTDNFTGQRLYPLEICLLLEETARKLVAANAEFSRQGYRLKVWDAYRPRSVQEVMFEIVPNPVYVADPATGSNHNRGTSVDVTLVDEHGRELLMPSGFDDFTGIGSRNYDGMPEEARLNMEYLTEVMVRHGFQPINSEWWHFDDIDYRKYPHLEVTFEQWVEKYHARNRD